MTKIRAFSISVALLAASLVMAGPASAGCGGHKYPRLGDGHHPPEVGHHPCTSGGGSVPEPGMLGLSALAVTALIAARRRATRA